MPKPEPEPEPEPPPVVEPPAPLAPTVQTSAPIAPPVMPFTPLVPTDEPPEEPAAQPIDLAPQPEVSPKPVAKADEPVAPPRAPTPLPPRAPTPLPPSPSLARGSDVEDKIVEAFERMQELFTLRDHDEVAQFALKVSREFIDCEAGSSMLITPGTASPPAPGRW
jgi:hypothetical protein